MSKQIWGHFAEFDIEYVHKAAAILFSVGLQVYVIRLLPSGEEYLSRDINKESFVI